MSFDHCSETDTRRSRRARQKGADVPGCVAFGICTSGKFAKASQRNNQVQHPKVKDPEIMPTAYKAWILRIVLLMLPAIG